MPTTVVLGCSDADGPPADEDVAQTEQAVREDVHVAPSGRTVFADVVAIEHVFVYDRFGAYNPSGTVHALRRDVVAADPSRPVGPGNAALRPGKRPRPLVLRDNAGDTLSISFTNWLTPSTGALAASVPSTRSASIHVVGLQIRDIAALGGHVGQNESSLCEPGETCTYELFAGREGTFLMRGRKVLINFAFTSCKGACPAMTENLARVQALLRARGERVTMLTITVDPENDTPAVLKRYAERFKAGEGWYFLTGTPENVAAVLRRLGGQVRRPEEHMMTLLVGDTSTGVWAKTPATEPPETLAYLAQHLDDPR